MTKITDLKPRPVWEFFEQITRIPRPSKREGKIRDFLVAFARERGLEHKTDKVGNVVIIKPGEPSMPTVVLQSHMDMVCEKNADKKFDFMNDPIDAYVDGGWVRARGTTLGADDGIGIAAALALLDDKTLRHGRLEALFTVDEETGLTGAFGLETNMITGEYLINLDSEEEGEICIGCAGGVDTVATFRPMYEPVPHGMECFRVEVSGLKGGHSGENINDGVANANKLLTRVLWLAARDLQMRLSSFEGGNLRNAIPREASATVCVPVDNASAFERFFDELSAAIYDEYALTEPEMLLLIARVNRIYAQDVLARSDANALLGALQAVQNGPLAMSRSIPGLVETSSNLASVKVGESGRIVVATSQRSSVESAKRDAAAGIEAVFALAGAEVTHSEGYPGWKPNPDSDLLKMTVESYEKLFSKQPVVKAIHAGLECGLLLEKYPRLDMVSFGPTLQGVHSPDEKLEIASVEKFWKLLVELLATLK
jgi:dipeptidase D